MSVAAIGPSSFVTCFELVGADGYEEMEGPQVIATLKKIVKQEDYKLIIIPERFAKETRSIREEIMSEGKVSPVFALIPDFTMETGMRMEELQEVVSLAIGTRLEL